MLTKWFGKCSSGSSQRDCFVRPWLESLEERNAPSSLVPMDHPGHDHGNDNGNSNGNGGNSTTVVGPANGSVIQSGNVHNNIHINITDSFNGSFNGSVFLAPGQSASVGALFAIGGLIAADLGNSSLGSLINDEIALAVDDYLTSPAIAPFLPASLVSSLSLDAANLQTAINMNPLESTLFGQVIGTVAFDVTMDALVAAQPTI